MSDPIAQKWAVTYRAGDQMRGTGTPLYGPEEVNRRIAGAVLEAREDERSKQQPSCGWTVETSSTVEGALVRTMQHLYAAFQDATARGSHGADQKLSADVRKRLQTFADRVEQLHTEKLTRMKA